MPSNQLLSSKTVIQEEPPSIRHIEGVQTAVPGFVGVTERGPFGATEVTADTYRAIFGGYTPNGDVHQALDGYFQNGGAIAHVSRVVHLTDAADPATKTSASASRTVQSAASAPSAGRVASTIAGPWVGQPGQTVVLAIDGGAAQTATIAATAASRDSAGTWPVTLVDGQTLTVAIDGGAAQSVVFATSNFVDISAATEAEVAAVLNAGLVGALASVVSGQVRIASDRKGTGSGVNVTGGSSNAALLFTTGNVAGTGNVSNVASITATELAAIVNAGSAGCTASVVGTGVEVVSDTTGGASSVQVTGASTFTAAGFDHAVHTGLTGSPVDTVTISGKTDGSYANALTVVVANATSGAAASFNLLVQRDGLTVETWPNLTMDSSSARYAPSVLNHATAGSNLIAFDDLEAAIAARRPANGSYTMTGGSDGLVGLTDADFIGGVTGNRRSGMHALDLVQDLSLLAVPGRATAAVHNAMIAYCSVYRLGAVFAVLDPPAGLSATEIVTYVSETAALEELSELGAIYWPRVLVANPDKAVFGPEETIVVPPSGHVCGDYARTDGARQGGVYDAPAGVERGILLGVLGFETDEVKDEEKRDLVYPHRINPITTSRGRARYIDGSYTLKSSGNWPTIPERRGVIFIEQSIKQGLEYVRHSNNNEALRAGCSRTVVNFLTAQLKVQAFRYNDPAKAFWVDFGAGLNTPSQQFGGKLLGRVGLATAKPVQWVVLSFTQDTRDLAGDE